MKHTDLDRAFKSTPGEISARIDQTLERLEEEKPVKKITMRAILVAALIMVLLCSVAYAVILQGQEWYYNNRFTAYQENLPQVYEAIMGNLQKDILQGQSDNAFVDIKVLDAAWLPDQMMLTVSTAASAKAGTDIELHPKLNMDVDGSYVGDSIALYSDDEEARSDHWLWTNEGHGPIKEMMADPLKTLMLFEVEALYVGTAQGVQQVLSNQADYYPSAPKVSLDAVPIMDVGSYMDAYVADDGRTVTVLEVLLKFMDEEYVTRKLSEIGDAQREVAYRQVNEDMYAAFEKHTDENGMLSLCMRYTLSEYTDDDAALYGGGETYLHEFKMKIQ